MDVTQEQRDRGFEAAAAAQRELARDAASHPETLVMAYTCSAELATGFVYGMIPALCDQRMHALIPAFRPWAIARLGEWVLHEFALQRMPTSGLEMIRRASLEELAYQMCPCELRPGKWRPDLSRQSKIAAHWPHTLRTIETELGDRKARAGFTLYTKTKVAQALELPSRLGARGAGEARDLQRYISTFVSPLLHPRISPAL